MRKIPRIPSKDWDVPFTRLWRICQKPRAKLHGTTRYIFHHQSPPNFRNQTYHLHLQHHSLSMPTQTMIKDTNKCTRHPVRPPAPTSTAKPPQNHRWPNRHKFGRSTGDRYHVWNSAIKGRLPNVQISIGY